MVNGVVDVPVYGERASEGMLLLTYGTLMVCDLDGLCFRHPGYLGEVIRVGVASRSSHSTFTGRRKDSSRKTCCPAVIAYLQAVCHA